MKAYKYISSDYAGAFESGEQISIGGSTWYSLMEGDRGDRLEGRTSASISLLRSPGMLTSFQHEALRSIGVDATGSSNVTVVNSRATLLMAHRYLFCCSAEPDALRDKPGETLFEISDLQELAELLHSAEPALGSYEVGKVKYAPRSGDPLVVGPLFPDPFIKDPRFSHENEVRIAWRAIGTRADDQLLVRCPEAATLIRRL